jgi:ATP-dependent RNA helicase SUPV3L1/SUV3
MATAGDHRSFSNLASRSIVRDKLIHAEQIELLWEVCQIPDFRQMWFELHVKLLEQLFLQLAGASAQIDPGFIEERLAAIDDTRGDLDTLLGRIADIRTWTYVATHPRWISYNSALRERTATVEDRLSDALHERLVSRFVERTRSANIGARPQRAGERVKHLGPFASLLDHYVAKDATDARALPMDWLENVINGSHEQFNVDSRGRISFGGKLLAQLEAGPDILHPEVRLTLDLDPGKGARSRLMRRLLAFGRDLAATLVTPLRVRAAAQLSPAGRGIVYQLEQNLGTISTDQALDQLLLLTDRDKQLLTSFGVTVGKRVAYVRRTHTPNAISMRAALVSAQYSPPVDFMDIQMGAPTLQLRENTALSWLICLGYVPSGRLGIRADHYDFVWQELTRLAKGRTFPFPQYLASKLGCSRVQLDLALQSAGYFPLNSGRYARRSRQQDIWRR